MTALLAFEATRDLEIAEIDIETPLANDTGSQAFQGLTLLFPFFEAGLGMAEAMLRVLPRRGSAMWAVTGMKRPSNL